MSSANLSHRYLWGPAVDQLLADEQLSPLPPGEGQGEGAAGYDLTTPGTVVWALGDGQNTVRDLATYNSGTGLTTIVNHRVYNAYGRLTSQTQNAARDCVFLFTGRYLDAATGLQNNWNRWYDPAIGGWLSKDPIGFRGGNGNLYRYAGNRPAGRVDPRGLQVEGEPGGVGDDDEDSDGEVEITFGHGARHLEGTGLSAQQVEGDISQDVRDAVAGSDGEIGEYWGWIQVNGQWIEYRVFPQPDGSVNVGTYFPVRGNLSNLSNLKAESMGGGSAFGQC